MTVQQATQQLLLVLNRIYEEREARNITDLVMEHVTAWKKTDRIINKQAILTSEKEYLLSGYLNELSAGKPVQYVLHKAWFYGLPFYVNEHVLIPRPETEELVQWVIEEANSNEGLKKLPVNSILDVGTGSGCIPVVLKKHLPEIDLYACDVSHDALVVAAKNASAHNSSIHFMHCDFLHSPDRNQLPVADIIVSNPPYIPLHDKETMHANVVAHEPHLALFVPDDDPLLFYAAMIDYAYAQAKPVIVFMEIHEALGESVVELFQAHGFSGIEIRHDLQGKERMVKACRLITGS